MISSANSHTRFTRPLEVAFIGTLLEVGAQDVPRGLAAGRAAALLVQLVKGKRFYSLCERYGKRSADRWHEKSTH